MHITHNYLSFLPYYIYGLAINPYSSHIHIYIKNHLPELICKSESNVSESIGDAGGNIDDNDISFS